MSELAEAHVRIRPDATGFGAELKAALAGIQTPEIEARIAVQSAAATRTVAEVSLRLDELQARVTTTRVGADDHAALDKLRLLKISLDEIGNRIEKPRVSLEGATSASLALERLSLQMDALDRKRAEPKVDTAGAQQGMSALIAAAVALGPALIPIGAAAVAGIGAIGAVALPAAAGLGAFGLVAKQTLTTVTAGSTAIEKYNTTLAVGGRSAAQMATAHRTLATALSDLSPAQRQAAYSLNAFQNQWQAFRTSFDPLILGVFTQGLHLLQSNMGLLGPLITGAGGAIRGLLTSLGHVTASPGFRSFAAWLGSATGAAITTIGRSIGNLAQGFGSLLMAFAPLAPVIGGGLVSLTAAFARWAATVGTSSGFAHFLDYVRANAPLIGNLLVNLGKTVVELLIALAPFGHLTLGGLSLLSIGLTAVSKALAALPGPMRDFLALLLTGGLLAGTVGKAIGSIRTAIASTVDFILGKKVATVAANAEVAASYDAIGVSATAASRAEYLAATGGAGAALGAAGRTGGLLSKVPELVPQVALVAGVGELLSKAPAIKLPGPKSVFGEINLNKILSTGGGEGSSGGGLIKHWAGVSEFFVHMWRDVTRTFAAAGSAISGWVSGAWRRVSTDVTGAWSATASFFTGLWRTVTGAFTMAATAVTAAWASVRGFFARMWAGVTGLFTGAARTISRIPAEIQAGWATFTAWMGRTARAMATSVVNALKWLYDHNYYVADLVKGIRHGWDSLAAATRVAWTAVRTAVTVAFNAVRGVVTSVANAVRTAVTGAFDAVRSVVTAAVNAVRSVVSAGWNAVRSVTVSAWNAVRAAVSTAWGAIAAAVEAGVARIRSVVSTAWTAIRTATTTAWDAIKTAVSTAWNAIAGAIASGGDALLAAAKKPFEALKSYVAGLAGDAVAWGENIIKGMASGIANSAHLVADAAKNIAGGIGKFIGFHSPTELGPGRDADKWMPNLVAMLTATLRAATPMLHGALGDVLRPLAAAPLAASTVAPSSGYPSARAGGSNSNSYTYAPTHNQVALTPYQVAHAFRVMELQHG